MASNKAPNLYIKLVYTLFTRKLLFADRRWTGRARPPDDERRGCGAAGGRFLDEPRCVHRRDGARSRTPFERPCGTRRLARGAGS